MNGENSSQTFKERYLNAKSLSYFAILLTLVVVLQLWGGTIRIGIAEFSLVLLPIVLGGILLGPIAGMLLGLVFGIIVYLQGVFGVSAFTMVLFLDHPIITAFVCLGKGLFCGLGAGVAYSLIKNKNKIVACYVASALCPIINTGLFILGALFMSDTLSQNFVQSGETVIYFLVIGCAGINFIVEFLANVICAPVIARVTEIIEKTIKK